MTSMASQVLYFQPTFSANTDMSVASMKAARSGNVTTVPLAKRTWG